MRHEKIYCPKCKSVRAYRVFSTSNESEVKYRCNICEYVWKQPKIFNFVEKPKTKNKECECGGIFKFSRLDYLLNKKLYRCNKCGIEKIRK